MKKKIGKIILIIVVLVFVACGVFIYFNLFYNGSNAFSIENQIEFPNSTNRNKDKSNGYWWGFNQNKIASIGDVIFTFTYDNSNLANGNSTEDNPAKCEFYMVIGGEKTKIGEASCNRPCNVIADATNNKIYYFAVEPVGNETNADFYDYTGNAKLVMYTFNFDSESNSVSQANAETVIPAVENDGAIIRLGTAVSKSGDLLTAYGSYNGYILAYVRAADESRWARYVYPANAQGHSMMYDYAAIESPDKFYILGLQDYTKDNETYYQYAKLYSFNGENLTKVYADESPIDSNGYPIYDTVSDSAGWTEKMVIDKTDSKEAYAVRTEDLFLYNNDLHIVVRDLENKIIYHYLYKNGELTLVKNDFDKLTKMVRIVENNGKLYYVTYDNFIGKIKIIDIDTGKQVYRKFVGIVTSEDWTIYVDRYNSKSINLLCIPKTDKATLYVFEKK